jgi:hypothetical protein
MRAKTIVHLQQPVTDVLRQTASEGGLPLEELLTAAIWMFSRQGPDIRELIVSDYCNRPSQPASRRKRQTTREILHALGNYFTAAVRFFLAR